MIRARRLMAALVVSTVVAGGLNADDAVPAATQHVDAATIRARVPQLKKLAARWEQVMNARGIAGMAVVVVQGDEVIFSDTFGERDPEKHLPVTMDTMFYIASCTKSYMAMGIMSLVEEGKVELDAPVKRYLPRFQLADEAATESLTVRDLLSHAKGLDSGPVVFLDAYTGEITEDRYYHWLRQATPTGVFQYTNVHYTLLGRIAESVSGQTWKDFLQSRIFEPAGMYHTTAYASKMYGSDDVAIPCEHNGTRIEPSAVRKNDRVMHAAGGLGTSANDLARWLRLNLRGGMIDGHRIVSQAGIADMQRLQAIGSMPTRLPHRSRDGYGFGWFVGSYHDVPMIDHGGGYVGTAATISFMPDQQLGVAVMTNGSSSLTERVAATIYDELLDFERGDLLDRLEASCERQHARVKKWHAMFARRPVNAERLSLPIAKYVGKYFNENWGTIFVTDSDGELRVHFGDLPVLIKASSKDAFAASMTPGSTELVHFVLDGTDSVAALVYDEEEAGEITFDRQ